MQGISCIKYTEDDESSRRSCYIDCFIEITKSKEENQQELLELILKEVDLKPVDLQGSFCALI